MVTQNQIEPFARISPYLVERPRPLIGAETIQLIVIREILDYTVLRTEDTRELNSAYTPYSVSEVGKAVRRVAFLGSKQKAAESRELEHLLRTARRNAKLAEKECYLKDRLCMSCPRCGLHGATNTQAGQQERANIKHRIEYSTAFSLMPFEDVATTLTFNAIDDHNQTTGQALGQRFAVQPATIFPSVVTMKSVTKEELILAIKALLACKSYGAEGRIGGDVRNTIWGVVAGWEEVITSLELTLELADIVDKLTPSAVEGIISEKYKLMAGNPKQVRVLNQEEVEGLVGACAKEDLNQEFLQKAYADIEEYRKVQLA